MEQRHQMEEPVLSPIKGGWAAHGEGWAVHGRTREEAVQKFWEAEQRHREIDGRPLWCDRREVELSSVDGKQN